MSDLNSINTEQRLYCIKAGSSGYCCLGFDVCEEKSRKYLKWLGRPDEVLPEKGTAAAYKKYCEITDEIRKSGRKCEADLVPQLVGLEGKRVKVVTEDGRVKRFWVGKSTGWIPVHLEIPRQSSSGGSQVYGDPFRSVKVLSR